MKTTNLSRTKSHLLLPTLACCLGGILLLSQLASQAQVTFKIDRVSHAPGQVTIEFTDSRILTNANLAHAVDFSAAAGQPGCWTFRLDTTFSSLGGAKRMVTLPATNTAGFYRIGVDSDCDGVSDGLAAILLGTNATFKIDRIRYLAGYVTIEFTDSRLLVHPNMTYAVDRAASVRKPALWTYTLGTTFSSPGGAKRMVTFPATNTTALFRIGVDSDGDGLSDGLEATLGTDPNKSDADGDGYSDLIELVNGTGPTNALSRPLRGMQPSVQFAATTSQTIEGAGTILIPVVFDALYSGQLHYSISTMSTATNGADFVATQYGVVSVNGLTAAIPLDIKDDLNVENIEAIVLQLEDDVAGTHHTGAFATHTVLLMDNDANWSGLLQSGVGETSFRLCILRSNATVTALLIPSPKCTTNHLGGELIPLPPLGQSGWPVTNLTLTDTQFTGDSVPLPAGSARLLGQVLLVRTFHFSAVPPPPGVSNVFYLSKTNATFGALMMAGEYAEVLASAQPGIGSQQFTNRGYFFLAREVPVMTPLTIPTTPVQP